MKTPAEILPTEREKLELLQNTARKLLQRGKAAPILTQPKKLRA